MVCDLLCAIGIALARRRGLEPCQRALQCCIDRPPRSMLGQMTRGSTRHRGVDAPPGNECPTPLAQATVLWSTREIEPTTAVWLRRRLTKNLHDQTLTSKQSTTRFGSWSGKRQGGSPIFKFLYVTRTKVISPLQVPRSCAFSPYRPKMQVLESGTVLRGTTYRIVISDRRLRSGPGGETISTAKPR